MEKETIKELGTDMRVYANKVIIAEFKDDIDKLLDYQAREVIALRNPSDDKFNYGQYWKDRYNVDIGEYTQLIGIEFASVTSIQTYYYPNTLFKGFTISDEADWLD